MTNKIDNKYYKENVVQLMLPISMNCIFVGPDGIKFQYDYGDILIDDYIRDSRKNNFPYHDTPIHEDNLGVFANQLFKLNKTYLAIYPKQEHRFRRDYFFEYDNQIYVNSDGDLKLIEQSPMQISLEELKRKFDSLLSDNKFVCFLNDDGKLYICDKSKIDFDVPLSGILLFGNGEELQAYLYKMIIDKEQITVNSSKLDLTPNKQVNLENYSTFVEPSIGTR